MKSYCGKCKVSTNQDVLKEETVNYIDETGWWECINYQIIRCAGCDTTSFRKLEDNPQIQSTWYPEDGHEKPIDVELFPNRSIHHLPISRFSHTPENINNIYKETIDAYNNNQLILCSGGLRAILEGICIEKGVIGIEITTKGGGKKLKDDLQGKIEGLAEKGFLTKGNSEILHNLRFIGNDALHQLSAPSKSELKLAIDIVEHTIESLYEIEFKAFKLKKKLEERKKPRTK